MKYRTLLVAVLIYSFIGAACASSPKLIDGTTIPISVSTPTTQPTAESRAVAVEKTQVIHLNSMTVARASHTATLLANGRVLITGGFGKGEKALASAELFDPVTRKFSPAGSMTVARLSHTATRLLDGKVLIAGGYNGGYLSSAELYDPATGAFTPTGRMTTARSDHTALLLKDGKVLLVGGVGTGWTFLDSAELYDPETGTFSATGRMSAPRESHTTTLLKSGKVLVTGGHRGRRSAITIYASAELYDPATGAFKPTGDMTVRRHKHDATLLPDGRVLVNGGADERDDRGAYASVEIYDPDKGSFTPAGMMRVTRYKHRDTSVLLPSGRVLLPGGASSTEFYDPGTNKFYLASESVGSVRLFATTTLLRDGSVLFAGGYGANISASANAWGIENVR